MKTNLFIALSVTTILTITALAGPPPAPLPVQLPSSEWEWRVGLPLWAGIPTSGNAATGGVSASLDMDVSNILDLIDRAAALSLEARYGRLAFLADGTYIRLSDSVNPNGRLITSGRLEIEQALVNAAVSYRFLDSESWKLDALAGARYNHIGLKFDVDYRSRLLRDAQVDGTKDWVDPFVGLQLRAKVCNPVTFVAKGEFGGFGVGSDISWQVYGGLEFQLSRNVWSGLGWRHLHTDYQDGNFNYDVTTTGPVLELGLNF